MADNGGKRPCERTSHFLHLPLLYSPAMSDRRNRAVLHTRLHSAETGASGTQRGEIDLRFILGAFVLIVLARPLAAAAVDIQSSLASTPAFSWFSGGVIAVLMMAAIAAAVLGLE